MKLLRLYVFICFILAGMNVSAQELDTLTNNQSALSNLVSAKYISARLKEKLLSHLEESQIRSAFLKENQVVRVLLIKDLSSIKLEYSGPIYIYTANDNEKHKIEGGDGTLLVSVKDGQINAAGITSQERLIIDPKISSYITFNHKKLKDNAYNGVLHFILRDGKMMIIEYSNLENYLLGVVGHEMNAAWPLEALKAQAVTARTFARVKMNKKEPNYDLRSTPADQVYKGSGQNVPESILQAVKSTRGEVLTYNGNLFTTFYHANCGGYTVDGQVLTGSHVCTIEPLQGVVCNNCSHTYNSCWSTTISGDAINKFVWEHSKIRGPVSSIKIEQTDTNPKYKSAEVKQVVNLRFITEDDSVILNCDLLQQAMGSKKIKTCKIDKIEKNNDGFVFSGCGFGHGVGMCQDGAKGMAENNYSYQQILSHYFPGSELVIF